MAEQYSIVYGIHSFLTHSSADGHLGCFHALAIVNSAVMNIGAHVSFSLLSESRSEWEESLKQQLEPDMDPWTDSKLGKEYVKTVYLPTLII